MAIFLTTLKLFGGAMAAHFVIWKARLPKRQIRTLLIICTAVFLPWLVFSLVRHVLPLTVAHIGLYFWSISLSYIVTYSAIEADSPTLSLMRFIGDSGSTGRSDEEITCFMEERPFLGARLAALIKSGLVREQDDRYVVAGRKSFAFRLILSFRILYGSIPKGG